MYVRTRMSIRVLYISVHQPNRIFTSLVNKEREDCGNGLEGENRDTT